MGVRYIEKCIANRVSSQLQQSVLRKMQKFSVTFREKEFCENTKCEIFSRNTKCSRNVRCLLVVLKSIFTFCGNPSFGLADESLFENESCFSRNFA